MQRLTADSRSTIRRLLSSQRPTNNERPREGHRSICLKRIFVNALMQLIRQGTELYAAINEVPSTPGHSHSIIAMMLLRNHGTLTVGRTVAEAFTYMYFLMKACEIQVRTLSCGPTFLPTKEAIETTRVQSEELGKAAALTWPALLRLLDSRSPGYAI